MNELQRIFGVTVRVLRTQTKLSQESLAKKVEVTRTQITNIEKGKTLPSFKTALRLSKELNIDLHSFSEFLQ